MLKIAIHGAAGRMGQRLIALAAADPDLSVAAALEHAGHAALGSDAGTIAGISPLGVPLTTDWQGPLDVVIDFSLPEASLALACKCAERKVPLVLATTGFSAEEREQLVAIGKRTALLWSPSMSLAVNLAMRLTAIAAETLKMHPGGADVEIIERHHRFKEDAPSGTALKFGQIIAEKMGQPSAQHGREGRIGARPHGEIGYHAVRTGDNPGEHTIVFGLLGETLEIAIKASNRDCYAVGALAAAKFLAGKPPGMYSIANVLRLE